MSLDALIDALDAAGVEVDATADGHLRIVASPGALTPKLRQELAEYKPALLAALAGFHRLDEAIPAVRLPDVPGPFPPLDDEVTTTSMADRYTVEEIDAKLHRLTARAAAPDATDLERAVADDWRRIRDAKRAGRQAA